VELPSMALVPMGVVMLRVTLHTRDRVMCPIELILALQEGGLAAQLVSGNGDLYHAQAHSKTYNQKLETLSRIIT